MKQAKDGFEGGYEEAKSSDNVRSSQKLGEDPHESESSNLVVINNQKALEASLKDSYHRFTNERNKKMSRVCRFINRIAFFLQSFWNEIMPDLFKGKMNGKIEENRRENYVTMRDNGNIIDQGSFLYCLDVCKRRKSAFIIGVFDEQQNLFTLGHHIYQRIKRFAVIPLKKQMRKEMELLSLNPRPQSKVTFYLSRFNFAGQLIIFSQIDGETNQDIFELSFSIGEFSANEYLEFEEQALSRFRNENGLSGFEEELQNV